MNARFVTLVLLLFVWLEGDSVWAQYLPKLYQVFSPDKKLKMAIQRHNDGLLTYTFAANREILIKESPLGFKLESQETVPSSGWKIEKADALAAAQQTAVAAQALHAGTIQQQLVAGEGEELQQKRETVPRRSWWKRLFEGKDS